MSKVDVAELRKGACETPCLINTCPCGLMEDAADEIERLRKRVADLEQWDREAAEYVESVICMRTHFTGEPPYVGWKGLGLALNEALDERDRAALESRHGD